MTGYDPQLLATFLAVEQTGSFTRAAARLGIQQPTVSQHIRRLEQQVGRTLVARDTHSVSLTADGQAMAGFARNILAASEQAAAYFSGDRPSGRLRIGIADDLALTRLPVILRDFRRDYPLVDFDLRVDQSGLLHQRLEADRLDLFIGKRPSGEQRGQLVKRDRLVWVGTPTTRLDLSKPLPLAVYPSPSITRIEISRALEGARLPFRTACICRGVNGLIGAVAAGIGISAMAASLVPAQLATLGSSHRLPELGTIDLVLLTNPRTDQRPAVRALIAAVLSSGSRSLTAYRDELPVTTPPVTAPPVTAPPVTAPPVTAPPISAGTAPRHLPPRCPGRDVLIIINNDPRGRHGNSRQARALAAAHRGRRVHPQLRHRQALR